MENKICATISLRLWCTLKGIYSTPPPSLWEGERIKKGGGGGGEGSRIQNEIWGNSPATTYSCKSLTYITDISLQYMKFTRSCVTPKFYTPPPSDNTKKAFVKNLQYFPLIWRKRQSDLYNPHPLPMVLFLLFFECTVHLFSIIFFDGLWWVWLIKKYQYNVHTF